MTRPVVPGQTVPVPFTLIAVPDAAPSFEVYESSPAGGVVQLPVFGVATLLPGTTLAYHASYDVPTDAVHGTSYQLLVLVSIAGDTTIHWLDGGTVTLFASQSSVDAIADLLGGGQVEIITAVSTEGDVTVLRKRDYYSSDGLALEWRQTEGAWPDLTGASVVLLVARHDCDTFADWSFDAIVTEPVGPPQIITVELDADTDLDVSTDDYHYELVATLSNGHVITLDRGRFSVELGLDPPEAP